MIQAVIFDMDGVIIDSELVYLEKFLEYAKQKNPNVVLEDLYGMVGASRQDSWEFMAKAVNNGQTWDELRMDFKETDDVYSQVDYRAMFRPEIIDLLEYIKGQGLHLALASSTQMDIILRVLHENQIYDYFEVIVSGAQFKRSKPDPEIYHYTAGQLGVSEAHCLVIEDSTFGITAAHRAGMTVAALNDNRFHFDQTLANYRIDTLAEVRNIIADHLK